jgi:protein-disulfide isomerase
VKSWPPAEPAYTGGVVPRHHYRPLLLAALCAPLLWAAAWAAESPTLSVDPALARGPADALVTIVEFSDYQCPSCKRAQQALGQVMKEFEGKVRLVHKDFPVPTHKGALPAALAARCAAAQGVFWEYHDLLYLAVPDFSRDDLVRYAGRLSLDREAFATCLDTHQFRKQIEADVSEGRALNLRGTPTFLVNGKPLVGAQPIEAFREAIRDALREAGAR